MTTPRQRPPSPHRADYRRMLAGASMLFILSLVTMACFPSAAPRQAEPPPIKPPVAEAPKQEPPKQAPPKQEPPKQEPPKQEPPAKLPDRPAGEPSQLVVNGSRTCKQIAFTYDAGSGADGAAAILDVLKKFGIHSTFFLTGKWVEKYPDLAKRIAAEGHEIGNHSYSHPDLTKEPAEAVLKQLKDAEEIILKVTGKDPRPLFREPYGAFDDTERRLVRQAGYSYSIYWDLDTLDWQFPGVDVLTTKLTEKAQSGSIVLMHMNVADTAVASEKAIPVLVAKGYKLVTVSELLKCK